MKWHRSVLCVALLTLVSLGSIRADEDAGVEDAEEPVEEDRAFLIARKFLGNEHMINGQPATVVIELHNAGDSAAYNVKVKDVPWDAQYFKADTSDLTIEFERVGGGQTVRHEYEVTPTSSVQGWVQPATVVYEATSEPGSQQTLQSTPLVFIVYGTTHKFWRTLLHIGRFVSFGHFTSLSHWKNFSIVAGAAAALAAGAWGYREVAEQRRRSKYNKALEAVQNMK